MIAVQVSEWLALSVAILFFVAGFLIGRQEGIKKGLDLGREIYKR